MNDEKFFRKIRRRERDDSRWSKVRGDIMQQYIPTPLIIELSFKLILWKTNLICRVPNNITAYYLNERNLINVIKSEETSIKEHKHTHTHAYNCALETLCNVAPNFSMTTNSLLKRSFNYFQNDF